MIDNLVPSERWRWPFVGVVVLLLLLILATPGLLGLVQSNAGSPATQAVLVLYRGPGSNLTEFHVQGVSVLAYHRISLGIAPQLAAWPVANRGADLAWTRWVNGTDTVSVAADSPANPLAVNVSAEFIDTNGAVVDYVGLYAFNLTGGSYAIQPLLSGLDPGAAPLAVSSLPQLLPLLAHPGGGS